MAGPRFNDGKEPDAMRTIGEVAAAFGIRQHVLRYWEQQFPMLRPLKRSGGRRYYRPEDVALVETIDRLINREGYTLKGASQAIEKGRAQTRPAHPEPVEGRSPAATPAVLPQLRAIRDRLAAALAA
jgi:DNA-binding transcriptional MerR regulator